MDTRSTKIKKITALVLAAVLLLFSIMALSSWFAAAEDNEEENGDKPELTIEVVEDIPAAEIEEQEVPLADTPMTEAADNTRTMVLSWTLGVVIIAYMVFLVSGMRLRKNRRMMQGGTAGDRGGDAGER